MPLEGKRTLIETKNKFGKGILARMSHMSRGATSRAVRSSFVRVGHVPPETSHSHAVAYALQACFMCNKHGREGQADRVPVKLGWVVSGRLETTDCHAFKTRDVLKGTWSL